MRVAGCAGYETRDAKNDFIFVRISIMPEVGFEPTPTNRIELKSTALDHSAIQAYESIPSYECVYIYTVRYDSRGIRTPAGRAH